MQWPQWLKVLAKLTCHKLDVSLAFGQDHLFLRNNIINDGLKKRILTDDLRLYASLHRVLHLSG